MNKEKTLAQEIANVITPVLLKHDIHMSPGTENAMRDDVAFSLASWLIAREEMLIAGIEELLQAKWKVKKTKNSDITAYNWELGYKTALKEVAIDIVTLIKGGQK